LEPEKQTLPGPNRIGKFLNWVAGQHPQLDVRILKWDIGILRSIVQGETPLFLLRWMMGGRVTLKLDAMHPPLSTHHMKLLVIDGALAFCGGIDMISGRWDTREHRQVRRGRRTPHGEPQGPWHDATMCVAGPVARKLAELGMDRWRRACDEELKPVERSDFPWPQELAVDFENIDVSIARTMPAYEQSEQVSEIEAVTLEILKQARRFVYIESQYFASSRIAEVIEQRLAEPDGPDFVITNPDTADGWLESKAMDSARICLMHRLRTADRHDRFRIFYPINAAGTPIYVHAKILIADDTVLKVGSANLNNRSMGFDTECDLIIRAEKPETSAQIARIRNSLLAEHLGKREEDVAAVCGSERAEGRLIQGIAQLNEANNRLVPLPMRELTEAEKTLAGSTIVDPERPSSLWAQMKGRLPLRSQ
nr:phospholipase [Pseudomonas sp.]